mgnify:CR=1 FL=1
MNGAANPIVVSVVSPCRNEIRHIRPFMESLLAQDYPAGHWELIVADGMSDDGTREALREMELRYAPRLLVIDNQGRIVSTGLNAAVRQARGLYVLRVDCHAEYEPDFIRCSIEVLEQTGADNVGGPVRTKSRTYIQSAIAAAYHSPFSCGGAKSPMDDYEGYADTVQFGCWRTGRLKELGLFDESLVRNQDDELNLRTIRAGGKIWQSPKIRFWYYPRPRLGALFRQYFQYGFWKVAVIRKHKIPASWRHVIPGTFAAVNVFLLAAAAVAWVCQWPAAGMAVGAALAIMDGCYLAVLLLASLTTARRSGWKLLPVLPVVFAIYHISYGIGFLAGLLYWFNRSKATVAAEDAFTRLTR